jgi:hypothetical protein
MGWVMVGVVVVLLVGVAAVAALTVGRVPERKPPASPNLTGDYDIWPFF